MANHQAAEFDWQSSPLPEAERRLADIKSIYDRAASVVLQRQSRLPVEWRCWSQTHKSQVPKSSLALCRGAIPDGKWVFKNDGDLDSKGHPAVCCSQQCYTVYWQAMSKRKYEDRLTTAAADGGSAPPGVDLEAETAE